MLIKRRDLNEIAAGRITLAFRRWKRPTVRTGGTLRTVAGVLAIDRVDRVTEAEVTESDARRAGFASRAALIEQLSRRRQGELYRIELRLSGPDPRRQLRERTSMEAEEVARLKQRLDRYDASSRRGPWTLETLRLIAGRAGTRAVDLADTLGVGKDCFKRNVRKLKELGLTESLEVGYRLSPRGHRFLSLLDRQP